MELANLPCPLDLHLDLDLDLDLDQRLILLVIAIKSLNALSNKATRCARTTLVNDADGDVGAPRLLVRIRMELANLPCPP